MRMIRPRFTSPLHDARVAMVLGIALGCCLTVAFVTGLFSHFLQHPGPLAWPSRPAGLYRVTQGVHVFTGIAAVPLLLAKLWAVSPRLWQWARPSGWSGWADVAVRRTCTALLVGGALFQLSSGLLNIVYWYPWSFFFTTAHYWTAYLLAGALLVHVVRVTGARRGPMLPGPPAGAVPSPDGGGPGRRRFLGAVGAASATLVLATVGETVTPLRGLALLAPRSPDVGPQGVPVNKTAVAAKVRVPVGYRLRVRGVVARETAWTLARLGELPQHTVELPIACVEGWSATARWTGVRLRDLLDAAGVAPDARVRVESLQHGGLYRTSEIGPRHWHDEATLLALRCNGEVLAADHGYPCRLIAPNRPGVQQTKWVTELVVR